MFFNMVTYSQNTPTNNKKIDFLLNSSQKLFKILEFSQKGLDFLLKLQRYSQKFAKRP